MERVKKLISVFSAVCALLVMSSCSHPDSTIAYDGPVNSWEQSAKNNGNYFQCGNVDLYKKSMLGWEEVSYCVLYAKQGRFGAIEYYVAVDNSSTYYSDWKMAHITPTSNYREYEVTYHGERLYCWGTLPSYTDDY